MKILFLSHSFSPAIGGIEASSELLASAFIRRGHEVRLITMTPNETYDLPYTVIRKPTVSELIKHHAWADIVYENNPCMRLGWPKLLFGKPSVIALHTWIGRVDGTVALKDKIKIYWVAQAKQVIAVSKAIQQRCSPSATIIGNSYDEQLFSIRPMKRKKDFVFLGRLVSDKGVKFAIHTFSQLITYSPLPEFKDVTLTIIGDGPERKKLEQYVAHLPHPDRIRFTGSLQGEDLVLELNRHRFQFIPSIWEEPFGIVALEGIACGLIPIASDGGGLPDAVGKAGVTFERGRIESLINVTRDLVQNSAQQVQLLAAAPAHLDLFNTESITQQFLAVIESVTDAR
jgi:glycosyltransferase involved in cell wall biosynthesis